MDRSPPLLYPFFLKGASVISSSTFVWRQKNNEKNNDNDNDSDNDNDNYNNDNGRRSLVVVGRYTATGMS